MQLLRCPTKKPNCRERPSRWSLSAVRLSVLETRDFLPLPHGRFGFKYHSTSNTKTTINKVSKIVRNYPFLGLGNCAPPLPHKNLFNCAGIRSTSRSSPTPNVTAASPGLSQNGTTPSIFNGKPLGPDHLGNIGGVYLYGQTAQSGGGPPSRRGCRLLIASSAIRPAAAELQAKRNAGAWKD